MRSPGGPGSPGGEYDPSTPLSSTDAVTSGMDAAILERFQVDAFLKAAGGGGKGIMGRMFGGRNKTPTSSSKGGAEGGSGPPTVEDMFTYSPDGIPTSLLKLGSEATQKAVKMFDNILKYIDTDSLTPSESVLLAQKILSAVLKRPELRDEIYAQLMKQTRANPSVESQTRCWELLFLVASCSPPSKDFTAYTSEYVHSCSSSETAPDRVRSYAERAWKSMKTTAKSGPRRFVPSPEEIEAAKVNRRLTTIVFFLDDTFEELTYDLTTTVIDGVEALSRIIRLQSYQTFSFFAARKTVTRKLLRGSDKDGEDDERHIFLDDNRFIADIVAEFRSTRADKREPTQCKLLFKKRMFRETDEAISEPMFINLSYVQAQHDYLAGNYPVGREDACQLAALQIHAEQGSALVDNMQQLDEAIERYFSRQTLMSRPREEWLSELNARYKTLEHFTKDDARMQMLRILRALPYGNSIFFQCRRIEDPIGLLPGKLILGINKRGVHFFRPNPKEYLHSAELRDIMQFGSSQSAVFFKMRVAGVLHIFQFETKEGEDICVALQTHINDVMMKRYQKARSMSSAPEAQAAAARAQKEGVPGQPSNALQEQMKEVIANANSKADQIAKEKATVEQERDQALEKVNELQDQLAHAASSGGGGGGGDAELIAELADTKTKLAEAELALAKAEDAAAAGGGKPSGGGGASSAHLAKLEKKMTDQSKEIKDLTEKLRSSEAIKQQNQKDKVTIEGKLKRIEAQKDGDAKKLNEKNEKLVKEAEAAKAAAEAKVLAIADDLATAQKMLDEKAEMTAEFEALKTEVEELREIKEDVKRKEAQQAKIINDQASKLAELEGLYKEEQTMRKRYFNQIEDMKGKIRVYARTRPISDKETKEGQNIALKFPDPFTLEHPWKEEKKPRSYQFDAVFDGTASQDKVFEDTKYLVQSAIDGYNVCIFAYGQTGSGKTHTINGSASSPGLTPRAIEELFNIIERDGAKFTYKLNVYMLELYQETLLDLLYVPPKTTGPQKPEPPKLEIKKDKQGLVTVLNAETRDVASVRELQAVLDTGMKQRHVAGTQMNRESSRSHLVIGIVIESTNLQTQAVGKGKLSFVDLAGSERVKKSGSSGEQLKEAQAINKSLSALGDVISSLASEAVHIPYRNHKLTMLMSDSLGGNAKTLMFVNVSPSDGNLDETQNSLLYAQRVRTIINDASKNLSSKEVAALKKKLEYWREKAGEMGVELEDIDDAKFKASG